MRAPVRIMVYHRGQTLVKEVTFDKSPIRIGRSNENDLVLPFDYISRFHCEIRREARGGKLAWVVVNLGSKNGLIADINMPVDNEYELVESSEFRVEDVGFIIETEAVTQLREAVSSIHRKTGSRSISTTEKSVTLKAPKPLPHVAAIVAANKSTKKSLTQNHTQNHTQTGVTKPSALRRVWSNFQVILGLG